MPSTHTLTRFLPDSYRVWATVAHSFGSKPAAVIELLLHVNERMAAQPKNKDLGFPTKGLTAASDPQSATGKDLIATIC